MKGRRTRLSMGDRQMRDLIVACATMVDWHCPDGEDWSAYDVREAERFIVLKHKLLDAWEGGGHRHANRG